MMRPRGAATAAASTSHRANDAYMEAMAPAPRGALAAPPSAAPSSSPAQWPPLPPCQPPGLRWRLGPRDPAGVLLDISDRPMLCGAAVADGAIVALGCADHAAYVVSARAGGIVSVLHGRTAGHSEWVTGVAATADGRLVSCAMDGRVLVWPAVAAAAVSAGRTAPSTRPRAWTGPLPLELIGHFGSVTTVATPECLHPQLGARYGRLLVSAGYDKTVRVWALPPAPAAAAVAARTAGGSTRASGGGASGGGGGGCGRAATSPSTSAAGCAVATLKGHGAPVLCLALAPLSGPADACLRVATGDRDGVVRVWEVEAARGAGRSPAAATASAAAAEWTTRCVGVLTGHRGHATALAWLPLPVAAMAGPDDFASPADNAAASPPVGGSASAPPPLEWALLSGAQDGHVRVWHRAGAAYACAHALPVHVGAAAAAARGGGSGGPAPAEGVGVGAVTDIRVAWGTAPRHLVVTAGADATLAVLDPSRAFVVLHRLAAAHSDCIYALTLHSGLALSGDGRGALVCWDVATGAPLWALGANAAAVRCILVVDGGRRLLAAGDDGKALIWDFAE